MASVSNNPKHFKLVHYPFGINVSEKRKWVTSIKSKNPDKRNYDDTFGISEDKIAVFMLCPYQIIKTYGEVKLDKLENLKNNRRNKQDKNLVEQIIPRIWKNDENATFTYSQAFKKSLTRWISAYIESKRKLKIKSEHFSFEQMADITNPGNVFSEICHTQETKKMPLSYFSKRYFVSILRLSNRVITILQPTL